MNRTLLTIILALLAAMAGAFIGCRIMMPAATQGTEIHALLHRTIALDPDQEARINALEAGFAIKRAGLEAQLRRDNAALAVAIDHEHQNGPRVADAIDRSHHTMGALQKATLAHVFAMRRVLRPDQAAAFDRVVVRALTATS